MAPEPEQTATTRTRKSGRKKGDGGRNNPKTNPMPKQRELQERAFYLSLEGRSLRAIAKLLGIGSTDTVARYVKIEWERRAEKAEQDRDMRSARSIETYEMIKRRAFDKSDRYDSILQKIESGQLEAKVSEHTLSDAIKAQERIDRISGIDAPTKVDMTLQTLKQALKDDDDPNEPLT